MLYVLLYYCWPLCFWYYSSYYSFFKEVHLQNSCSKRTHSSFTFSSWKKLRLVWVTNVQM